MRKPNKDLTDLQKLLALRMDFADVEGDNGESEGDADSGKPANVSTDNDGTKNISTNTGGDDDGEDPGEEISEEESEFLRKQGIDPANYDYSKITGGKSSKTKGEPSGQIIPDDEDPEPDDEDSDDKDKPESEVYRINKQEFTRSQLILEVSKDLGVNLAGMSKEKADRFIKMYVNDKNIAEGNKSINKAHQRNADERKALEKEKESLIAQRSAIEKETERIAEEKATLETKLADLRDKIADEFDDDKRTKMLTSEVLLEEKLDKLEEKTKEKLAEKEKIKKSESDNTINNMAVSLMVNFADEFTTEKPIADVLMSLSGDDTDMSKHSSDDLIKAERLENVIADYLKRYSGADKKPSITLFYEKFRNKYNPGYVPAQKKSEAELKTDAQKKLDLERAKKSAKLHSESKLKAIPTPKAKIGVLSTGGAADKSVHDILMAINQAN